MSFYDHKNTPGYHTPSPSTHHQTHPSAQPVQMLYSGIFTDERILQLLRVMQTLSEHCFSKLHDVSNEGRPSSSEYAQRFRRGLDSIEYWRSEIKAEETRQALNKFPELGVLYKYAIVCYLKELYKNERTDRIPVSIPPLQDFIHSYYVALSKTSYMQKLEFLNVYGLERTHMHMESLRAVLMDFTRHSIYKPASSSDVLFGNGMGHTNTPSTGAIRGLVSVEKDVTQWDSVSQRGDRQFEDEVQEHHPVTTPQQKPYAQQTHFTQQQKQSNPTQTIYDKATAEYYNKNARQTSRSSQVHQQSTPKELSSQQQLSSQHQSSNQQLSSQQTPPTQYQTHTQQHSPANLEIEKDDGDGSDTDSRSSHSESSSSVSSAELKFKQPPVFPKTAGSVVSEKRSKTSSENATGASSAHTIHLNTPSRPRVNPPPNI
jgi:hypothetical protein